MPVMPSFMRAENAELKELIESLTNSLLMLRSHNLGITDATLEDHKDLEELLSIADPERPYRALYTFAQSREVTVRYKVLVYGTGLAQRTYQKSRGERVRITMEVIPCSEKTVTNKENQQAKPFAYDLYHHILGNRLEASPSSTFTEEVGGIRPDEVTLHDIYLMLSSLSSENEELREKLLKLDKRTRSIKSKHKETTYILGRLQSSFANLVSVLKSARESPSLDKNVPLTGQPKATQQQAKDKFRRKPTKSDR